MLNFTIAFFTLSLSLPLGANTAKCGRWEHSIAVIWRNSVPFESRIERTKPKTKTTKQEKCFVFGRRRRSLFLYSFSTAYSRTSFDAHTHTRQESYKFLIISCIRRQWKITRCEYVALRRCKRKSDNTRANVTRRTHGRRMTTTKNCNINKYVYNVLKADGGGAAKMPRAAATFTHMHILCSIHTNRGICGAAAIIIYGLYPLSRSPPATPCHYLFLLLILSICWCRSTHTAATLLMRAVRHANPIYWHID